MKLSPWERSKKYGPRKGLEGPIHYPNGRILYKEKSSGEYWDPTSDYFVPDDEVNVLKASLFNLIKEA